MPNLPQIYLGINYYHTMLRANTGEDLIINFIKIFYVAQIRQEQVFGGISILCWHAKLVDNVKESSKNRYPTDHFRHIRMSLKENDLLFTNI